MKALLRALPKVDELLRSAELEPLCREYGENAVTDGIRREIDVLRQQILAQQLQELPGREALLDALRQRVRLDAQPSFRHGLIGPGVYASHGYERSHIDGVYNTLKVLCGYLEV